MSQLVATMAAIDIPRGEGDDIITTLVDNITQRHHPSNVKQVALQTIGYICESTVGQCGSDLVPMVSDSDTS